jgi:hypothetical protein
MMALQEDFHAFLFVSLKVFVREETFRKIIVEAMTQIFYAQLRTLSAGFTDFEIIQGKRYYDYSNIMIIFLNLYIKKSTMASRTLSKLRGEQKKVFEC